MAKIVLAFHNHLLYRATGNSLTMPAFYEGFIKGLQDAGNELLVYNHTMFWGDNVNINDYRPTEKIKFEISSFKPDIVILFNNSFYDISNIVNCPIVIYEVDSPLYYSNKKLLKKSGNKFLYCTAQSSNVDLINQLYKVDKKNIIHIPFFSMIQAEEKPIKSNICFIGSKFCGFSPESTFNRFMKACPDDCDIEEFKKCIEILKKNVFLTEREVFNIVRAKSEKVKFYFNKNDLIWFISDSNRIRTLSQVADLGLNLYGNKNWMSDLIYEPELTLSYKNVEVYSVKQNQDIYNSSKIGININHMQATHGFSWRVCDIMASNACLVSSYTPDLELLFSGINIPTFTNRFEARELCIKLLNNENMRKDIVLNCQEVINKKYRFENLLTRLESFTNINLHTNGATSTKFVVFQRELDNLECRNISILKLTYCCIILMLNILSFGYISLDKKSINSLKEFLDKPLRRNLHKKELEKKRKVRLYFMYYTFMLLILQVPLVRGLISNKFKEKIINRIRKSIDVFF